MGSWLKYLSLAEAMVDRLGGIRLGNSFCNWEHAWSRGYYRGNIWMETQRTGSLNLR